MLLLLDSCHVPIAIPANFAAARAIARVVGAALARNLVAIVRVVFSETAFSIVLARRGAYVAMNPALGN